MIIGVATIFNDQWFYFNMLESLWSIVNGSINDHLCRHNLYWSMVLFQHVRIFMINCVYGSIMISGVVTIFNDQRFYRNMLWTLWSIECTDPSMISAFTIIFKDQRYHRNMLWSLWSIECTDPSMIHWVYRSNSYQWCCHKL